MYEYISGRVAELAPTYAVIDVGGVGYYLNISLQTYTEIEHAEQAQLYVHHIVREDAQLLYGFASKVERELFRLLLGVSGVGGNTARMILSTYSPRELPQDGAENHRRAERQAHGARHLAGRAGRSRRPDVRRGARRAGHARLPEGGGREGRAQAGPRTPLGSRRGDGAHGSEDALNGLFAAPPASRERLWQPICTRPGAASCRHRAKRIEP